MAKAQIRGGATLMAALLVLGTSACGGDDASTSDPQRFIGTWKATTGQLAVTCPGLPVPADDLAGETLTVTAGTDAPIEATISGCKVKFDIAGDVATARPNQTCMITYPTQAGNLAATLTIASAGFTLKSTGGDYAQAGNATVTIAIPGLPGSATCSYQITASATKMM